MLDILKTKQQFNDGIDRVLHVAITEMHTLQIKFLNTVYNDSVTDADMRYIEGIADCVQIIHKLIKDNTGHINIDQHKDT